MKMTLEIDIVDETPEKAAEMRRLLTQYFTGETYPLMEDYGVDAWGGYDGPLIEKVTVT